VIINDGNGRSEWLIASHDGAAGIALIRLSVLESLNCGVELNAFYYFAELFLLA
jgi:hypothetical protein